MWVCLMCIFVYTIIKNMENTFLILRIDREKRELFHKAAKELNSDATKILTKKIDYIINKSKALETK